MATRKGAAAAERLKEFTGHVRRWEKRWVKADASKPTAVYKWVAVGPGVRTDEERLAKRRKYEPLRVAPVADLESYLPPAGAGWGGEKAAAVAAEPEAPRRSLRARTERTYVDGEDDEEDERSVSEDEPPPPPRPAAAAPPQPAAVPVAAVLPQQPAPPVQPLPPLPPPPAQGAGPG